MNHMLQLNPSIPVEVIGKGTGEAIGWFDYGKEDDLLWLVALDNNGECWLVPNKDIRFIKNYSIGRNLKIEPLDPVFSDALRVAGIQGLTEVVTKSDE